MKVFSAIVKVVVALVAVAGAVYVIATYGDKIVAWAKGLLGSCKCCGGECACDCHCDCHCEEDDCECECQEEAPVEEAAAEVVAADNDFEG